MEENYKNYFTDKKTGQYALIGKYVELKDAYKSLDEALTHGGIENNTKVNLIRIDSEKLKISEVKYKLKDISEILIPGGFGREALKEKIQSINMLEKIKYHFLAFVMECN